MKMASRLISRHYFFETFFSIPLSLIRVAGGIHQREGDTRTDLPKLPGRDGGRGPWATPSCCCCCVSAAWPSALARGDQMKRTWEEIRGGVDLRAAGLSRARAKNSCPQTLVGSLFLHELNSSSTKFDETFTNHFLSSMRITNVRPRRDTNV